MQYKSNFKYKMLDVWQNSGERNIQLQRAKTKLKIAD